MFIWISCQIQLHKQPTVFSCKLVSYEHNDADFKDIIIL